LIVSVKEDKEISWVNGCGDSLQHYLTLNQIEKTYRPNDRDKLGFMLTGDFRGYEPIWGKESE
jgi:hypothetical protein